MSNIVTSITSYLPFKRTQPSPEQTVQSPDSTEEECEENVSPTDPDIVKENDALELLSDKKTDELYDPAQVPGFMWRMTSGIYQTTSSAVGLGVGSVKWAAGKGYSAGTAIVGTTKAVVSKVPIPTLRKKDKKE